MPSTGPAVVEGAGTFVESVLVPGMVGLTVTVVILAAVFRWFARVTGRVT
jgi:hypothetical protein